MTEVVFALLPRVILLDVAGPAEAFRIANRLVPGSYTLRYVGSTRAVDSAVGLRLAALRPLPRKLPAGSTIIVTGIAGTRVDRAEPAIGRLADWLGQIAHASVRVCGQRGGGSCRVAQRS
jgi:transcriptional regulator GlxA family with amidase domain